MFYLVTCREIFVILLQKNVLRRLLSKSHIHARYFGLLLWPQRLSADWYHHSFVLINFSKPHDCLPILLRSFDCIPLITSILDSRNLFAVATYSGFAIIFTWSIPLGWGLRFTRQIVCEIWQSKGSFQDDKNLSADEIMKIKDGKFSAQIQRLPYFVAVFWIVIIFEQTWLKANLFLSWMFI